MRPVRSDRLGEVRAVAAGDGLSLFYVPPGETWLVKRITVFATSMAGCDMYVVLIPALPEVAHALLRVTLAGLDCLDHETWWAIDGNVVLATSNTNVGPVTVQAFGAKLQGVA